jgi:hypothetical protein
MNWPLYGKAVPAVLRRNEALVISKGEFWRLQADGLTLFGIWLELQRARLAFY